jgi:hypothetical protein
VLSSLSDILFGLPVGVNERSSKLAELLVLMKEMSTEQIEKFAKLIECYIDFAGSDDNGAIKGVEIEEVFGMFGLDLRLFEEMRMRSETMVAAPIKIEDSGAKIGPLKHQGNNSDELDRLSAYYRGIANKRSS